MNRPIHFANGGIHLVGDVLQHTRAKSVFLVTGQASYVVCGAEAALRDAMNHRQVIRFCEFQPNPKLGDVEKGVALFREHNCDVILAVGGGSVLDMAKLIGIFSAQRAAPMDILQGERPIENSGPPVIAIPTTAGSGSEVTHFATVYADNKKYSLAHKFILPDYAIIDPELTYSLPPQVTAVTCLDTFCHAVESMWSINATDESLRYSKEAIHLAIDNVAAAVTFPSKEVRRKMCMASYAAGKAINMAKTTAPHAVSYAMTSYFGVPHGHAVALTLGPMLMYNSLVNDHDVTDARGTDYVRRTITELNALFGCQDAEASCNKITKLIESIGLSSRLSDVGIRSTVDRQLLAENVNLDRLANNPRTLTTEALRHLLEKIA